MAMASCDANQSNPPYSFDLNIPNPPDEQPDEEMDNGSIPVIVRRTSHGTLLLDLNMEPDHGSESQILELDVDGLQEEDDFQFPDVEFEEDDNLISTPNSGSSQMENKRKQMTNKQRWNIYNALLEKSVDGKLRRQTTKEVSLSYFVPIRTVQRIWKRAKNASDRDSVDVSHKKKKNCGRKRVPIDLNRVLGIELNKRTNLRSLAVALGVSYPKIFRLVKEGLLRRHSNAIKPYLKEENKRARLQFCLSMLDQNTLSSDPKFKSMYNVVHIDEKWFYLTKRSETYYLLPSEEDPLRTCQSKKFITKVMFLAATARPRFDDNGNETFSGKIGIFPFVTMQPARRKSRNRDAGTLEMKPITSVTREVIKSFLIEKILPKIQEMWPREDLGNPIFIQQDNARTHVDPNDEDFKRAACQNGFDIRLMCQPSNSPDLNILDLGFFRGIQALQHQECPRNVEELVQAVHKSYDDFSSRKVDYIFLTLSTIMHARDYENWRFESI